MIKTRVSNCMEWIIRKLEKSEMAEVKKKSKAIGRGKSNKTPSGAGKKGRQGQMWLLIAHPSTQQ